ncbi:MAG: hypothetical protein ABI925_09725 [Verrucomicrobiota bacterium]
MNNSNMPVHSDGLSLYKRLIERGVPLVITFTTEQALSLFGGSITEQKARPYAEKASP